MLPSTSNTIVNEVAPCSPQPTRRNSKTTSWTSPITPWTSQTTQLASQDTPWSDQASTTSDQNNIQDISDLRKLLKEDAREEFKNMSYFLGSEIGKFRNEINEMFVKNKFMLAAGFAKFESQAFENNVGSKGRKIKTTSSKTSSLTSCKSIKSSRGKLSSPDKSN